MNNVSFDFNGNGRTAEDTITSSASFAELTKKTESTKDSSVADEWNLDKFVNVQDSRTGKDRRIPIDKLPVGVKAGLDRVLKDQRLATIKAMTEKARKSSPDGSEGLDEFWAEFSKISQDMKLNSAQKTERE